MLQQLIPFGNFLSSILLSLEIDGFGIPFLDGGGYGVHGHDASHEGGGGFLLRHI